MREFKYCVIGNNTKENRKWLIDLGYTPLEFFLDKKYIYTNFSIRANYEEKWKEYYFGTDDNAKPYIEGSNYINCIDNNSLFKAVSALQNDNDYMQWFTCKTSKFTHSWHLCKEYNYIQWAKNQKPFLNSLVFSNKASLEELIKHFK